MTPLEKAQALLEGMFDQSNKEGLSAVGERVQQAARDHLSGLSDRELEFMIANPLARDIYLSGYFGGMLDLKKVQK